MQETQFNQNPNYKELMERDYPEEMKTGGFVENVRDRCRYLEKYPEAWEREPKWFREAYKKNPEEAILQMSYEILESFA